MAHINGINVWMFAHRVPVGNTDRAWPKSFEGPCRGDHPSDDFASVGGNASARILGVDLGCYCEQPGDQGPLTHSHIMFLCFLCYHLRPVKLHDGDMMILWLSSSNDDHYLSH